MAHVAFFAIAAIAVASALGLILRPNAIHGALFLVVNLGSVAALYLMLGAEFLAAAQVIVYAGAIMVLFVFVIMLLNAGAESKKGRSFMAQLLGVPLLVSFLGLLAWHVQRLYPSGAGVRFGGFRLAGCTDMAVGACSGNAANIGRSLFTTYLLPFEITSVLVLIAQIADRTS